MNARMKDEKENEGKGVGWRRRCPPEEGTAGKPRPMVGAGFMPAAHWCDRVAHIECDTLGGSGTFWLTFRVSKSGFKGFYLSNMFILRLLRV